MKLQELFEGTVKHSASIKERQVQRQKLEDASTQRALKHPQPHWPPEKAQAASDARLKAGAEEDAILHKVFGEKDFRTYTTGYNGGAEASEKYNAVMSKLGFERMETDMNGKPAPALGPKPEIKTRWKRVGAAKGTIGTSTFYQLKDSDQLVVMQTISGDRGMRYLFIEK